MKKLLNIITILSLAVLLTGCSGGIYSNLRQIEHLLVVQTLGIDSDGGGIVLTASAQPEKDKSATVSAGGASVTGAMSRLDARSADKELFFAHTGYLLFGEDAAKAGITPLLDYVCRSPELRMDIPLFIVSGGSAKELMDDTDGIHNVLRTLTDDVRQRGDGLICTASQAVNGLYRDGSFLLRTLRLSDSGDGGTTAVLSGYAVMRGGTLCAYIDADDALAVSFLQNAAGVSSIDIAGAALELGGGGAQIKPVYDGEKLAGIDFELNANAAVAEITGSAPDAAALAHSLEAELARRTESVLRLMRERDADFLGLAAKLGITHGELMSVPYRVSVSADIVHSSDLADGSTLYSEV